MSYLYHWRKENYQTDPGMDKDPPFEHGICLNSKNKLFSDIDYGDVIYAFSRRDDGVYHHGPRHRLKLDPRRYALSQDPIDNHAAAVIDLRRRNPSGTDPFERIPHVVGEARDVRVLRIIDRLGWLLQYRVTHLGYLTNWHDYLPLCLAALLHFGNMSPKGEKTSIYIAAVP